MQAINQQIIALWQWFEHHHHLVETWELLPAYIKNNWFNELFSRIRSCCDPLGIRLTINHELQLAELLITAEGNPDYFDDVDAIVQAAPSLPGWTFVALVPPQDYDELLPPGCFAINIDSLQFSILKRDKWYAGVRIFIPGYSHEKRYQFRNVMIKILINLLGEYNFGHGVPYLELTNLPSAKTPAGLRPFLEMPDVLENIWANGFQVDDELLS